MSNASFVKNPGNLILLTAAIIIALVLVKFITSGQVLGQKTNTPQSPIASTSPTFSPMPTIEAISTTSPNIETKTTPRTSYTIAIYGDSMVDTMGDNLEYLQKALFAIYPATNFKLYNYGIGSQNIEDGITRFENDFNYKERKFPSIVNLKPDIIVLGSFAYNPFSIHDVQKHFNLLNQLALKAKKVTSQVYLLAEVAPLGQDFGKGEHGVNWPNDQAKNQALRIIDLLINVQKLSDAKNIPIFDAFSQTQQDDKFGSKSYVDDKDGIHPSVRGHVLMANLIARTLKF